MGRMPRLLSLLTLFGLLSEAMTWMSPRKRPQGSESRRSARPGRPTPTARPRRPECEGRPKDWTF
eukprot:10830608-Heterocapsa_arctica.AAC.1